MKPMHFAAGASLAALASAPLPRAIHAAPRADGKDPASLFAQLNAAVTEMRQKHEESLKSKVDDTVLTEQVGRIDSSISTIEAAMNDLNMRIATGALGQGNEPDPHADPEYSKTFASYFKHGDGESMVRASQFNGPRAALSEGSPSDGGYLAPVEWDRTIIDKLKLISPMRQNATVVSTTKPGFTKLFNDRVIGSGWVGETAARPATSTPQLTPFTYTIGEIYANPAATQTILDDAEIDVEKWLADEVEYEFSVQENIAYIGGNGVNKPAGILTYVTGGANAAAHPYGAIPTTTVAGAAAITADEVVDLVYALPSERNTNAKFFLNRASLAKIRKLKDGQGNFLWQPSYVADQPSSLMGYPIVEMPGMPNMTTGSVSILFGDMKATYLVIDRLGIRVLRDPYTNKPYVHFYTTKRVGGGLLNPEYMRAIKQA